MLAAVLKSATIGVRERNDAVHVRESLSDSLDQIAGLRLCKPTRNN